MQYVIYIRLDVRHCPPKVRSYYIMECSVRFFKGSLLISHSMEGCVRFHWYVTLRIFVYIQNLIQKERIRNKRGRDFARNIRSLNFIMANSTTNRAMNKKLVRHDLFSEIGEFLDSIPASMKRVATEEYKKFLHLKMGK